MSATMNDYAKLYGNIVIENETNSEFTMARCACVACNSCTCACSCRYSPESNNGEIIW